MMGYYLLKTHIAESTTIIGFNVPSFDFKDFRGMGYCILKLLHFKVTLGNVKIAGDLCNSNNKIIKESALPQYP